MFFLNSKLIEKEIFLLRHFGITEIPHLGLLKMNSKKSIIDGSIMQISLLGGKLQNLVGKLTEEEFIYFWANHEILREKLAVLRFTTQKSGSIRAYQTLAFLLHLIWFFTRETELESMSFTVLETTDPKPY